MTVALAPRPRQRRPVASDRDVDDFWAWFAAEVAPLDLDHLAAGGYRALDRRVVALGFSWEAGPADDGGCFLALSPGRDAARLALTRAAVARAPAVPGWTFLPAKPSRVVDLRALVLHLDDGPRAFDVTTWDVVAYRFDDGVSDLVFRPPPTDASPATLWLVASTIVDGELGEARAIEVVHQVEVVAAFEPRAAPRAQRVAPGLLARLVG